jgi:hypothetical protein
MSGVDSVFMVVFLSVGGALGAAIAVFVAGLIGFLGDVHASWQTGRRMAQLVTEKQHNRRVELLARMIELERAMQKEAETKDQGDIDAAGKTEEARQISAMTLAALNAAYPNTPLLPSVLAKEEDGE